MHRKQPFQGAVTFRTRIPKTEYTNPASNVPLSLQKISVNQFLAKDIPLYPTAKGELQGEAKAMVEQIVKHDPAISLHFRMDKAEGSHTSQVFNELVVLKPEFLVRTVELQMYNGMLGSLKVKYTNGVSVVHGCFRDDLEDKTKVLNLWPHKKEAIMACSIETGIPEMMRDEAGEWKPFVFPPEEEEGESEASSSAPATGAGNGAPVAQKRANPRHDSRNVPENSYHISPAFHQPWTSPHRRGDRQ